MVALSSSPERLHVTCGYPEPDDVYGRALSILFKVLSIIESNALAIVSTP